jgi:hypothetical protein
MEEVNPYESPVDCDAVTEASIPLYTKFLNWLYYIIYPAEYCKIHGHNLDFENVWLKTNWLWDCKRCGAKVFQGE